MTTETFGNKGIILSLSQRPVDPGFPITAGPGERGARWQSYHKGIDFGKQRDAQGKPIREILGANVYAVMDGRIAIAGPHLLYDKETGRETPGPLGLRIWHHCLHPQAGSIRFGYCHLREILVNEGDTVKAGQIIGHVGNTGNSSAAHLHFQPETWPSRELLRVEFV